ncbi:MAG: hypothetical protein HC850_07275 [Rhodomicrobium sp.]|nr:hypothetical protein [Rhodomicrobium sp.]
MASKSEESASPAAGRSRGASPPTAALPTDPADLDVKTCDFKLYEPAAKRLQSRGGTSETAGFERFVKLGEDSRFIYFYDMASGELSCAPNPKPGEPSVLAARPERVWTNRIAIIWSAVAVIVLASCGLIAIQLFRLRQQCS